MAMNILYHRVRISLKKLGGSETKVRVGMALANSCN